MLKTLENSEITCADICQALPFSKVKHQVSTLDAQPVQATGGIMILVTGALLVSTATIQSEPTDSFVLQVDEEQRPMNYSQCFQLLPDGAGSYYIFNDIFKLVFGA